MTVHCFGMDPPYCEVCGEKHASVQTMEAGLCDDCFADEVRSKLMAVLGKRCCFPMRQQNGELAVCLAEYGVEHLH